MKRKPVPEGRDRRRTVPELPKAAFPRIPSGRVLYNEARARRRMGDRERAFVEGKGTFVEDMLLPETLHLRIVRSPYARARLLRVRGGITHADLNATVTSVGGGGAGGGGMAWPG